MFPLFHWNINSFKFTQGGVKNNTPLSVSFGIITYSYLPEIFKNAVL